MSEGEEEVVLKRTITIRASDAFKESLQEFARKATAEVDGEVKVSDLVRLGLDWVLAHSPSDVVDFLVGDKQLSDHL